MTSVELRSGSHFVPDQIYPDDESFLSAIEQQFSYNDRDILSCYPYSQEDLRQLLSLARKARKALGRTLYWDSPFESCGIDEFQTVINTATLASRTRTGPCLPVWTRINSEPSYLIGDEGLLCLEIGWYLPEPARILQIGFSVDHHGDLIIGKSQRHCLGKKYRRWQKTPEKRQGDILIKNLQTDSGFSVEAFGILAATMVFGSRLPGKNVSFYKLEEHPQYQIGKASYRIGQMIDFTGMLKKIGVNQYSFCQNGRFFSVPLSVIQRAIDYHLTDDDNFPDRLIYRKILTNLSRIQDS